MPVDEILDDLFHVCALAAYLDPSAICGVWPPDSESTRRLAYHYYEETLAEANQPFAPLLRPIRPLQLRP